MQTSGLAVLAGGMAGLMLGGAVLGAVCGRQSGKGKPASAARLGLLLEVFLRLQLTAVLVGAGLWAAESSERRFEALNWRFSLSGWTVLAFDGTAWLMSLLVGFVGWNVCRFSRRYLAGDDRQAAYWGWLAAALASVQLMVAAGNLLLLLVAWTGASLFLHQLLLYHSQRTLARRAAATKFIFSRLADVALYSAAALLFWRSGTLELESMRQWLIVRSDSEAIWISLASLLFALGAAIRSAQVPFHFWLPQALDTPTPVSALMHAGIVNAGGYAAVRLSFLLIESPLAMNLLALFGLATALVAGLVMLTQPTIKGSLAWSTVAQMGFMLLQCGVGAFSAAMLHIIAHSLYKAHAFLSSGNVIAERAGLDPLPCRGGLPRSQVLGILLLSTSVVVAVSGLLEINLWTKPGGVLLGGVLTLGLVSWLLNLAGIALTIAGGVPLFIRGLVLSVVFVGGYFLALRAIDSLVQPPAVALIGMADPRWGAVVWILLAAYLVWNRGTWLVRPDSPRMEAWQVHASQGFYLDSVVRRVIGSVAPSMQR